MENVEPLFDELGLNNTENKPVRENPQVIVPAQASNNDSAANKPSDRELVLQFDILPVLKERGFQRLLFVFPLSLSRLT